MTVGSETELDHRLRVMEGSLVCVERVMRLLRPRYRDNGREPPRGSESVSDHVLCSLCSSNKHINARRMTRRIRITAPALPTVRNDTIVDFGL